MSIRSKQQKNLMRYLFDLPFSRWPVTLGLYPDHLTTTAENARKGALMALAGGDHTRARRFLAQGGIEGQDEFDKLTREFSKLVAEHAELMETLPDPAAPAAGAIPGRQPSWSPARLARHISRKPHQGFQGKEQSEGVKA